eukprot:1689888-Alexandrium_andersonii.AAC.1
MHPSEASGINLKAVLWPSPVRIREPEATLHVPNGGLRVEADCSTAEPCADCRSHFRHLATQRSQQV